MGTVMCRMVSWQHANVVRHACSTTICPSLILSSGKHHLRSRPAGFGMLYPDMGSLDWFSTSGHSRVESSAFFPKQDVGSMGFAALDRDKSSTTKCSLRSYCLNLLILSPHLVGLDSGDHAVAACSRQPLGVLYRSDSVVVIHCSDDSECTSDIRALQCRTREYSSHEIDAVVYIP